MPTAKELRLQAKDCLELADKVHEYYAKAALTEIARELTRAAHQTERRERDFALYGAPSKVSGTKDLVFG
jgi:hypothetical protein